eukprot:scaffold26951_cov80-Phaeocystis_antarctica.AAC.5
MTAQPFLASRTRAQRPSRCSCPTAATTKRPDGATTSPLTKPLTGALRTCCSERDASLQCQKRNAPSHEPLIATSEKGTVVRAVIQHAPPHEALPCAPSTWLGFGFGLGSGSGSGPGPGPGSGSGSGRAACERCRGVAYRRDRLLTHDRPEGQRSVLRAAHKGVGGELRHAINRRRVAAVDKLRLVRHLPQAHGAVGGCGEHHVRLHGIERRDALLVAEERLDLRRAALEVPHLDAAVGGGGEELGVDVTSSTAPAHRERGDGVAVTGQLHHLGKSTAVPDHDGRRAPGRGEQAAVRRARDGEHVAIAAAVTGRSLQLTAHARRKVPPPEAAALGAAIARALVGRERHARGAQLRPPQDADAVGLDRAACKRGC